MLQDYLDSRRERGKFKSGFNGMHFMKELSRVCLDPHMGPLNET